MKKILEKRYVKFFISEILMLLVNILFYQLFCIKFEKTISSLIAVFFALVFDYFLCIKYVFKDELKDNHYRIIQFVSFGGIIFLLKHFIVKLLYYNFSLPLLIAKIFSFLFGFVFNYFVKYSIFLKNFRMKLSRISSLYQFFIRKWKQFISMKHFRFIFKFLPQNLFIFLFFVFSLYYTFCFFRGNDDKDLYKQVVSDDTIELLNNVYTVNFSNISVDEDVDIVCLAFGTYGRKNDSSLLFELYNENQKKVYDYKINTNILSDGSGFCINVPLIKKEKLKNYSLNISSFDANKNNHVALFIDSQSNEPTLYLKKTHNLFSFKYIMMFFVIVLFFLYNYYFNRKNEKIPESKFLILMGIYFLFVLILTPPFEIPDEPSHLYSSYNLSQNWFDANETTEIVVPEDIECLNYSGIQFRDRVVNFDDVTSCLKSTDNRKTNSMFGVSNHVTTSFLGHLPQAISIKIVDTFSNSSLLIFYFARLGNFFVSFLILYIAVKMAPVGKKIILFIALTPMFVQQMISLSYDAILNSLSLLFIAYIIKLFYCKEKVKARDILIPTLYLLVMLTIKMVYVPLAILLFFIPKDRFRNFKQKIIYLVSIIALVLIGRYLIQVVLLPNLVGSNISMNTSQIDYILKNPFKLFEIAINTLKINGWFYLRSLVGYFSWFRFSLSDFTVYAWLICFILLILNTQNIFPFSSKNHYGYQKKLYILSILISIGGIFASMYFGWSEYALNYVDGVQGRYFIPILGFIALLFMPKNKKINFSRRELYCFCNILIFQYLIYLLTYFY